MSNLARTYAEPSLFEFNDILQHSSNFNSNVATLSQRKECFLHALKGDTLKYKRYTKSPLRYGGGKSLAVGLIVEHFPNDISRIISPFIGGGSVEVASALELNLEVKAFDIFDILVNFWQLASTNSQKLYDELCQLEPNKETYAWIKDELKSIIKTRQSLTNSRLRGIIILILI